MKKLIQLIAMMGIVFTINAQKIIDHTSNNLGLVPDEWVTNAKKNLKIMYWHASHGYQVTAGGMLAINNYLANKTKYAYNPTGSGGALCLNENSKITMDLNWPGHIASGSEWYTVIRKYLDAHIECNVAMMSWCDINRWGNPEVLAIEYCKVMENLISEYGPGGSKGRQVNFVYFTSHNNAGYPSDLSKDDLENKAVYNANKYIRDFCKANNRWLYDFNDLESYDPDGNYFGDGNPSNGSYAGNHRLIDDCTYLVNINTGNLRQSWCQNWMAANPDNELSKMATNNICIYCPHSDGVSNSNSTETTSANSRLQCVIKGVAAWHLWASLAGWQDTASIAQVKLTNVSVQGIGGATEINNFKGSLQMIVTALPSNATNKSVLWSLDGTGSNYAGINSATGLLTAKANGTVIARATATDGSGVFGTCNISITNQTEVPVLVSSLSIASPDNVNTIFIKDGTVSLSAAILPSNATNKTLNWSVVNGTGIATVDASGMVKAISNGTVRVIVKSTDGSNVSDSFDLTIDNQTDILISSINITSVGNKNTISVPGGTLQLGANILPANASNKILNWSIINGTGSASIDATGLVKAVSNGTVTVVVKSTDGSNISRSAQGIITNQIPTEAKSNNISLNEESLNESKDMILYPNPARNEVYISIPNSSGSQDKGIIYIVNSIGKEVITKQMDSETVAVIDLSTLKSGIYIVLVQKDNKIYSKKLIHN